MSLEAKIEALTQAVQALTAKMESGNVAPQASVAQPAPVAVQAPVAAPVVETPAPAMPAPPSFAAPAPQPSTAVVPFNDGNSMLQWVMGAYQKLGVEKGQQIQNVLTNLGYSNINDVKPEHYAALHQGITALGA